jgi:hypothetical protein
MCADWLANCPRDRSETIEEHELRLGLLAYGVQPQRRELARLWAAVGGDLETGALTYDQFAAIVAKVCARKNIMQRSAIALSSCARPVFFFFFFFFKYIYI